MGRERLKVVEEVAFMDRFFNGFRALELFICNIILRGDNDRWKQTNEKKKLRTVCERKNSLDGTVSSHHEIAFLNKR